MIHFSKKIRTEKGAEGAENFTQLLSSSLFKGETIFIGEVVLTFPIFLFGKGGK